MMYCTACGQALLRTDCGWACPDNYVSHYCEIHTTADWVYQPSFRGDAHYINGIPCPGIENDAYRLLDWSDGTRHRTRLWGRSGTVFYLDRIIADVEFIPVPTDHTFNATVEKVFKTLMAYS